MLDKQNRRFEAIWDAYATRYAWPKNKNRRPESTDRRLFWGLESSGLEVEAHACGGAGLPTAARHANLERRLLALDLEAHREGGLTVVRANAD